MAGTGRVRPAVGQVGPLGVQLATGTLVVTSGAGQVVSVHPLPALAASGVQISTGTLVVLFGVQVVEVKVFRRWQG
jgi:hypothetical protein